MSDLTDTTEMYLRTIFELVEEGIVPLRARIAERLHQSCRQRRRWHVRRDLDVATALFPLKSHLDDDAFHIPFVPA